VPGALFILFREIGTYNFIPDRGTDSESTFRILVMVFHMMILDGEPEFVVHVKVMYGIMSHIIKQIAYKETCHKWSDVYISQYCFEQEIEKQC